VVSTEKTDLGIEALATRTVLSDFDGLGLIGSNENDERQYGN